MRIPALSVTESYDFQFLDSIDSSASFGVRIAATRAYGSLLCWDKRQSFNSMTKQRLAYVTLPVILSACGTNIDADYLCPLTMLAHITCNLSTKAFSQSQLERICSAIVRGLRILADSTLLPVIETRLISSLKSDISSIGKLALSSILKIMIESEASVSYLSTSVTIFLFYKAKTDKLSS